MYVCYREWELKSARPVQSVFYIRPLKPLIFELNYAWLHGIEVSKSDGIAINIKVALCITCDIPASKKVCGFLSHNAAMGCNKCLKRFPVIDKKTYFNGFDEEEWTLHTLQQHVTDLKEVNKENTKTGCMKAESKYGLQRIINIFHWCSNPILLLNFVYMIMQYTK